MKNHQETVISDVAGTVIVSQQDLYLWGMYDIAYIKQIGDGEELCYRIFTADGGPIAYAGSRDEARASIREMDLEPLSVH